jgi:hypothetical protein
VKKIESTLLSTLPQLLSGNFSGFRRLDEYEAMVE